MFFVIKRLNVSQSFCPKSWVVKMAWPQMRVIKGAGVHHHHHYHYHLHLDALPLPKLLGIYFRKMRLICIPCIFPLSNLKTAIGEDNPRSVLFPMKQRQDGFSIWFLFNRECNATLSLSSYILFNSIFIISIKR